MNQLKINTSPSLYCRHTKCAADRGNVLINTKKSNKIYCTSSSSTQIFNGISKAEHTTSTTSCKIIRPHISGKWLNAAHNGHPLAKESKSGTPKYESLLMTQWQISGKTRANNVIHYLDFLSFNSTWDHNDVAEDMMFQWKAQKSDIKYEYNLINALVSWTHYFEPNNLRSVKRERKLITNGGIKTTTEMRSSLFWGVTQYILVDTDISGQSIRVICKGHSVQDGSDCPETSVATIYST
jgi:hypothetical protein